MKEVLKATNLTYEFSPGKGAKDINLSLNSGEIIGFIGPNGAGKTTTIRMLMGLLRPESGELMLFSKNVSYFSDFPAHYNNIGFLPSEPAYHDNLTAKKMFELKEALVGKAGVLNEARSYAKELDLDINKPIKRLSLGNKRKVGFILSILGDPKLIILDEPTTGLDPLIQRKSLEILEKLSAKGAAIFLSSHNLAEVEYICDKIIIIKDSKIIYSGSIKEIKSKANKKLVFTFTSKEQLKTLISGIKISKEVKYLDTVEVYTSEHIKLTKRLIEANISDFTVENPTLEEMFIDYYK